MTEADKILNKHLNDVEAKYIADKRFLYDSLINAINEALAISGVVGRSEQLPSKEEMEIKLDYLIENKPDAFNKYDEITFRFGFRTCFYWLDKKLRK